VFAEVAWFNIQLLLECEQIEHRDACNSSAEAVKKVEATRLVLSLTA
jgi:hypothetical protein